MAKRLGGITCDHCLKVLDYQDAYIIGKSKRGGELHYCSQDCFKKHSIPKLPRVNLDSIITDEEAAEFIHESNAIEEIHYNKSESLAGWKKKGSSIPEIHGQVKALRYVLRRFGHAHLTINVIEKVHRLLMKDLLPKRDLGLRRRLVWVGTRLCPYPIAIRPMLEQWLIKVNSMVNPSEEDIWKTHLAYEHIHPFIDGNGRSGRLFWLWLRYKHNYGYSCIYNKNKLDKYYPQFHTFLWENWLLR